MQRLRPGAARSDGLILPRKRFNSEDSALRDCLMSSSKRASRLGLGLVSGVVSAAELSGSPRRKRRLSLWAAPRHRPDAPWRNTLRSSPRAVKRPDFVGFVIWDLYRTNNRRPQPCLNAASTRFIAAWTGGGRRRLAPGHAHRTTSTMDLARTSRLCRDHLSSYIAQRR